MEIKIYSTQTCPYCKMAKQYISAKGFAYTDYDVGADKIKAKEMVDLSNQMGVPVIVIGAQVIIGFDKTQIDTLLDKK